MLDKPLGDPRHRPWGPRFLDDFPHPRPYRLFFRRHYPVNSITFCSTDPQDRRWTNPDGTTSKIFGFVAKKPGSPWENVCHLFAELDPDQPAGAIVTFITKVLLGQRK